MNGHDFYTVAIAGAFLKSGMHESCTDIRGDIFRGYDHQVPDKVGMFRQAPLICLSLALKGDRRKSTRNDISYCMNDANHNRPECRYTFLYIGN